MTELTEIIETQKAIKSFFPDKREKKHKLEYLNGIWEAVAQSMNYANFQIDELAQQYINFFSSRCLDFYPELKENPAKGLLVMGDVGTGKSCNFRIYQQIYQKINIKSEGRVWPPLHTVNDDRFYFVHVKQIESGLRLEGEEFIERLVKIKKLVIDDLGVDSDDFKDYGNARNPVVDVINRRYDKMYSEGLVTHFTTNLNANELKKKYGDRNVDRLREMTVKIGIKGKSKRV
jgi:DNA replication protein DnaC